MARCKKCGTVDMQETIYKFDDEYYCRECLFEELDRRFTGFKKMSWDDIEEEYNIFAKCAECGNDNEDDYYFYDGEWMCEECLMRFLDIEKV